MYQSIDDTIDDRLNPIIVEDKLLEIFNINKNPSDNYTIGHEIPSDNEYSYSIFIYNNGNTCCELILQSYENGKIVINIGTINRCGDDKSGTKNITNIIRFGMENEYDIFKLYNISEINYKFPDSLTLSIELTILKLLEIGNSWYSQFGFESEEKIELPDEKKIPSSENSWYSLFSFESKKKIKLPDRQIPISKYFEQSISPIISSSFGDLMVKYNEYVDEYVESLVITRKLKDDVKDDVKEDFNKIKNDVKEDFNKKIKFYIVQLNKTNIPELAISKDTIIKDYIKKIITLTIEECPRNICPNVFKPLLQQLIDFIYFLSYVVVSVAVKNTGLVKTSDNKRIRKIICDFIANYYSHLELNLKDLPSRKIKNKKTICRRKLAHKTRRTCKNKKRLLLHI